MAQKEHIVVVFYYPGEGYAQSVDDFEKGKVKFMTKTNAIFGTYYENIPYSKMNISIRLFLKIMFILLHLPAITLLLKPKKISKISKGYIRQTTAFPVSFLKILSLWELKKQKIILKLTGSC